MERLRDDNALLARQLHDVQKLAADEIQKKLEDAEIKHHSESELLMKRIEWLEEKQSAQQKTIQGLQAELSNNNTTRTGTQLENLLFFGPDRNCIRSFDLF